MSPPRTAASSRTSKILYMNNDVTEKFGNELKFPPKCWGNLPTDSEISGVYIGPNFFYSRPRPHQCRLYTVQPVHDQHVLWCKKKCGFTVKVSSKRRVSFYSTYLRTIRSLMMDNKVLFIMSSNSRRINLFSASFSFMAQKSTLKESKKLMQIRGRFFDGPLTRKS